MAVNRDSFNFFGLDLATVFQNIREGWGEALTMPKLAWLGVEEVVRVIQTDGTSVYYRGRKPMEAHPSKAAGFLAVMMPEDVILHRTLHLPRMSETDLLSALSMEVASVTPFGMEQTTWGFHKEHGQGEMRTIHLAMTSRGFVARQLDEFRSLTQGIPPEVWAPTSAGPVVLQGYAEKRRTAKHTQNQLAVLFSLILLVGSLITLAAIPVAWKHTQLTSAESYYRELQQTTRDALSTRDQLNRLNTLSASLPQGPDGAMPPLELIERLTAILPDDAWIDRIEIQTGSVQITGRADDGAGVLTLLNTSDVFFDARSTAPITRDARSGKDRFVIQFKLGPKNPDA